jgi:hypothetical protein
MRRRPPSYPDNRRSTGSRYSATAMWVLFLVFLCCACLLALAIGAAAKFQNGF